MIKMCKVHFVVVAALLLACSCRTTAGGGYQLEAESRYFDQHRTDTTSLITQFYTEGRVLLLGAANHRNVQHHLHLIDLLKNVGTDPQLKYLVLEQTQDNAEFYRRLSTSPIEDVLKHTPFRARTRAC